VLLVGLAGCGGERAAGRPWVRHVTFEGVDAARRRALASRLGVERRRWFGLHRRFLEPSALAIDSERIESFYRARGFFGARVVKAEAIPFRGPPERPRAVDVRFVVEEGAPTRISAVAVDGLQAHPELVDATEARLVPGEVFDHAAYRAARDAIGERLLALGHPWPGVRGRVDVSRRRYQARIQITVEPGPLGRFHELRIEGAKHAATWRLARYAGLPRGARFNPAALDELRARLEALGLFSTVSIDYEEGPAPGLVDVVAHIRERTRNELRLGGGLAFDAYHGEAHLAALYLRRHWLGGLRTLELTLKPGWVVVPAFWNVERHGPSLQAEAALTQPGWPLPRGRLHFLAGYDLGVEYGYRFHGPRTVLRLERGYWRDRVLLAVSHDFEYVGFSDTDPVLTANPRVAGRRFGYTNPYRLGWFAEELVIDLRDAPLEAHRGVYFSLTAEQGGPFAGGAFLYQKLQPELRFYVPLGRRVTMAGRFWFGQLFSEGDFGSPITRRFYLGGASSHRGFNFDRLSPQVPSGIPGAPAIPIGGEQMVLISAELRLRVLRVAGQWVSLATFFDGGDVGGPNGVDWNQLHWATGGGLRYRTPLGTVRIDVGVRLNRLSPAQPDGTPNPDPGRRLALHLSLGEAF
jgi:outer membrane protein assembly factor BamA